MLRLLLLIPAVVFLPAACTKNNVPPSQPPALVEVVNPSMKEHQASHRFVGWVEAIEDTTLFAQIDGTLQDRHFQEGDLVEQGQALFTLDKRKLSASVERGRAQVASAEAELDISRNDLERGRQLVADGHISKAQLDQLEAKFRRATAQLRAASADLEAARVNLSYATVVAPFTGRISDSKVAKGELVVASRTGLADLVSVDPIHVTFHAPEGDLPELFASGDPTETMEVLLSLGGHEYAHMGTLTYLGNRVDRESGTLKLQASFPNPEHVLLPGEHAGVLVRRKKAVPLLTVPGVAIQSGTAGDYVFVVDGEQKARRIPVLTGPTIGNDIAVVKGLNQGDRVVTVGLQHLAPGKAVTVKEAHHE